MYFQAFQEYKGEAAETIELKPIVFTLENLRKWPLGYWWVEKPAVFVLIMMKAMRNHAGYICQIFTDMKVKDLSLQHILHGITFGYNCGIFWYYRFSCVHFVNLLYMFLQHLMKSSKLWIIFFQNSVHLHLHYKFLNMKNSFMQPMCNVSISE